LRKVLDDFFWSGDAIAAAKGVDGSWARTGLPKEATDSSITMAGSPRAETAVIAPISPHCHSNPEIAPIVEMPETQIRKVRRVLRLKETFEKRAAVVANPISRTPRMPWANSETGLGLGQLKAWEEVQARVEAVMSERLEEWSRKFVDEQGGIQAQVQRSLDLAEESNKACSQMAQQLEDLSAASFATVPQVEESIREKVEEMETCKVEAEIETCKVEAEHSDEVSESVTSSSMPKTVAAIFDDLEQVVCPTVSLVDASKTSLFGNTPVTSSEAMAGEIEVQPSLKARNAETHVVDCLGLSFRELAGDVDTMRKSFEKHSDEVRLMEASFRSEIDEIQLSVKHLGNTSRLSCGSGRSPARRSHGETKQNTDSSCTKQRRIIP